MIDGEGVAHAPGWIEAARRAGRDQERERVLRLFDSFLMMEHSDSTDIELIKLRAEVELGADA